jgi:hypothetical protein
LREFLAPSVRHLFDAYLARIRQNPTDSGLLRLVAQDGRERVWEYRNVRYDEPGSPPRVLGHALDITERIVAEHALKESEERFRLIAENARDMICLMDLEGRCVYASPASWATPRRCCKGCACSTWCIRTTSRASRIGAIPTQRCLSSGFGGWMAAGYGWKGPVRE